MTDSMVSTISTLIRDHVTQCGRAPLYLCASVDALTKIRAECDQMLALSANSEYASISGLVIVPVDTVGFFLRVGI